MGESMKQKREVHSSASERDGEQVQELVSERADKAPEVERESGSGWCGKGKPCSPISPGKLNFL